MDFSDVLPEGHELQVFNELGADSTLSVCRRKKIYYIVVRAASPEACSEYCRVHEETVLRLCGQGKRFCMVFDFRQAAWHPSWKDSVLPFAKCHSGLSEHYKKHLTCTVMFVPNKPLVQMLNTMLLITYTPVRPIYFEDCTQPCLFAAVRDRVKENYDPSETLES
jgi:hypothetical protein